MAAYEPQLPAIWLISTGGLTLFEFIHGMEAH
jgi:hypothetical protein